MPIRVYDYGLLPPRAKADHDLVLDQMRKAHRYRNLLVEIERQRRDRVRAAMSAHPDLAPLLEELAAAVTLRDEARQAILNARKATRSRSETAEQRALAKERGGKVKAIRERVKAERTAVAQDEGVRAQMAQAEKDAKERIRRGRALCEVYWGTYLLQEADADAARRSIMPPKFVGWRGEGRVSVQLQGGLSLEELFGTDTQLHIDPVAPEAHDPLTRRGQRRRAGRTTLRIRVGSDRGRPIWAEFPMIYHRPLPPGTRVKIATVSRRRKDCRTWAWRLQMTVDIPEAQGRPVPATGAVALNLGFCQRQIREGELETMYGRKRHERVPTTVVRAGYLVGDDGQEQEIVLPHSVRDAVAQADSIRSFRDKNMDQMKPLFTAWLSELRAKHEEVAGVVAKTCSDAWSRVGGYITLGGPTMTTAGPLGWFYRRVDYIHVWRSADRFRRLALDWRTWRFPGDEVGYQILEDWRHRDEHLERYEVNMRRRALLRRREHYRIVAAALATRYRVLIIDDTNLMEFQRSPAPESADVEIAQAKYNQRLAAGSLLRSVFVNAFGGGSRIVKQAANDATRRCHACGAINAWDRATGARMHTCTGCGATWDQDANNGRNHLAQYRLAVLAGDTGAAAADAPPPRAVRLRAAAKAKREAAQAEPTPTRD